MLYKVVVTQAEFSMNHNVVQMISSSLSLLAIHQQIYPLLAVQECIILRLYRYLAYLLPIVFQPHFPFYLLPTCQLLECNVRMLILYVCNYVLMV